MKPQRSSLGERGQVTIPKAIRDKLGLKAGTVLQFRLEGGKIIATKEVPADPLDKIRGVLANLGPVDKLIDELRGKP